MAAVAEVGRVTTELLSSPSVCGTHSAHQCAAPRVASRRQPLPFEREPPSERIANSRFVSPPRPVRTPRQQNAFTAEKEQVAALMAKFGAVTDSAGADGVATELVDLVKSVGVSALTVGGGSEALCGFMGDRKSAGPCEAALKGLIALCESEPALTEAISVSTLPSQLPCFADRADSVKEATLKLVSFEAYATRVRPALRRRRPACERVRAWIHESTCDGTAVACYRRERSCDAVVAVWSGHVGVAQIATL